jgi:methionyl-tRNA formyltransferase
VSTFYHKRTERDRRIDWSRPARSVHDLVRAQADPYPNAFTVHRGRRLLVKRAVLPRRPYRGTPGRVFIRDGDGVVVVCGEAPGTANQGVVLLAVQPEGGDPIAAAKHFERMGDDLE